ncbi:MAG: hypothetical protein GY765_43145 [bacterium]|nr:hypothetical protein [bacterium]
MKKIFILTIISILLLMPVATSFAASNTPCTDAWIECGKIHGEDDESCDFLWDFCMASLYDRNGL